jgi:hypothetical protein
MDRFIATMSIADCKTWSSNSIPSGNGGSVGRGSIASLLLRDMDSASTDPFILFSSFVRGLIPSGSCLGLDDGKSFFHGVCTLDFDVRRW